MPIPTYPNGNIGDYGTVSGDFANVSGSYVELSGDYSTHSGNVANPHHVTLDEIEDPDANVVFAFGNKTIEFRYAAPSPSADTGAFTIEALGAFGGDLVHIHQSIGNPGAGTHLLHMEATDPDVNLIHLIPADNTATGIQLESGIFTLDNEAKIVNSPDPTNAQDVATKNWTDTTFATITNFNTVSGDYATTSGTVDGYTAHVASSTSHHNPTGYETISGDYLTTSGTVEDYATLSGDFSTLSGDWGDFDKTPGGGAGHITGLSGGAWSVFYSEADTVITGLALGSSGLVLSSMGTTSAPVWAAKVAGGGDDLGSHIATLILDMDSKRITGLASPVDDTDATTKKWTVDYYTGLSGDFSILSGDISDYAVLSGDYSTTSGTVDDYAAHKASTTAHHDPSGYDTISGDYLITSGTIDDYAVLSGDFSTLDTDYAITSGTVEDYATLSGDFSDVSGDYLTHEGDTESHHIQTVINDTPTDTETTTGVSSNWAYDHLQLPNIHHIPTALNDTPTDGEDTTGATSNWAYDHEQLPNVHHIVTAINDTPTDTEATTGASSNWAYDHTQNPTDLNHISDAQLGALHSIYTLEVHDNTEHNPDYLANVSEDGSPELGADLDLAGYNISLAPSFGSDHQQEGLVVAKTTDAGAYGQALYMKSNGAYGLAQADAAGTMPCSAIYVASGKVLLIGTIRDDTYDFTVGGYVYVSESSAGGFTTTAPSTSTNLVQKVGIADSADSMYFNPGGFRTVTVV